MSVSKTSKLLQYINYRELARLLARCSNWALLSDNFMTHLLS